MTRIITIGEARKLAMRTLHIRREGERKKRDAEAKEMMRLRAAMRLGVRAATRARIILIMCLFYLSGCTKPPESGTVVSKRHEPARTWTSVLIVSNGKTFTPIILTHYDDEDFVITIRGIDSDGNEADRELYTDETTYAALRPGDEFPTAEAVVEYEDVDTKDRS